MLSKVGEAIHIGGSGRGRHNQKKYDARIAEGAASKQYGIPRRRSPGQLYLNAEHII
jgi:hypothetical protein